LRTVLGQHPLGVIVLDEPWEALDPDAGRWLSTFLLPHYVTVLRAHEIVSVGPVTAEHLVGVFDRLRGGAMLLRATP
jgi:hypothetical protein